MEDDYSEPLDLSLPSVKLKNRQSSSDLPLDLSKKRIDNPQTIQLGPFSNTVIKNIPNFSCDKRFRVHPSCGASSLPYMNTTKPRNAHTSVPVRNMYPDNYEDELESSEKPFNFSCRYGETKSMNISQNMEHSGANYKGKKIKNSNGSFTIYAETDLDQPTDYSLRYAENNPESESEESDNEEKATATEFVGDSVKTYCTEGTPYETPFNFSTSTSMSDLRISDKGGSDGLEIREETKIEKDIPENELSDKISEEEIMVTDDQPQTPKIKSEFNSGLTSPEKPMNYCEEGTPGYFSRVSSFGSLNSAAACSGEEKSSEDKDKCGNQMKTPKSDKMQQKLPGSEVKVVKFENIVNYCEETPLMFSRSSSMGSLDSIEQSMHDDRSSVISDFSRLTSGIISPSEIPDSPTQTVPPSPKQRKSLDSGIINRRQSSARRSLPTKSSIFEDDVTKFKEENTPAQFSVATSLSSLTIDDQDDTQLPSGTKQSRSENDDEDEEIDVDKVSLHDEADGMSFHKKRGNIQNRCFPLSGSGQFQSNSHESTSHGYNEGSSVFQSRSLPPPLSAENNVHTYNTEDTPAVLSRNGSISELSLSTLSILDEEPVSSRVYLSENSSQSSGDARNNLDEDKRSEATNNRMEMEDVWVRRESAQKSNSNQYREIDNLPPFLASADEFRQYTTEDSPAQLSLRSSLSHLTMESDMASGILEFFTPKESLESPQKNEECHPDSMSQQNLEHSPCVAENLEAHLSVANDEVDEDKEVSTEICLEKHENVDVPNENSKSFEFKSDDSRCNSMKKRKWKWKWQFASEDGHSESGDSTQTDKQLSSNIEEFDQGRRCRVDKNNSGGLDASLRKKKWWKWKFGSKEKDQSGGIQVNDEEKVENRIADEEKGQASNCVEEKEHCSNEGGILDTRSKSKRWKWKWKLGFKDDDSSKSEKSSFSLSKLKHHVSPEASKVPVSVADVLQSEDVPKEMNSLMRFLPEKQSMTGTGPNDKIKGRRNSDEISNINIVQDQFRQPVREKLDTPEPSDSEHSLIIEEIDDNYLSEVDEISDGNLKFIGYTSDKGDNKRNNITDDNSSEKESEYVTLAEDCIQVGVLKTKIQSAKTVPLNQSQIFSRIHRTNNENSSSQLYKDNSNVSSKNCNLDLKDMLEECIQLGMPKSKVPSQKTDPSNYSSSSRMSPRTINGQYKPEQQGNKNKSYGGNEYVENNMNRSNPSYQAIRNSNRTSNFDSSSLNRFSLDKTRNAFNSNDNILTNVSNQSSEKMTNQNSKVSIYNKSDGNGRIHDFTKGERIKVPGDGKEFVNEKVGQVSVRNSESKRIVPENSNNSFSTKRGDMYSSSAKNMGSRSTLSEVSAKSAYSINSGVNPDYASLIEECIQLGMPKRKESSKETCSPTSLMHQKMNNVKKWPEYLSNISNENRSASLPKSSNRQTSHSYRSSNEDFEAADLQTKRDMVFQRALKNNPTNNALNKVQLKAVLVEKNQERIVSPPPESEFNKCNSQYKEPTIRQGREDSLYANVDETRSYFSPIFNKEPLYGYESSSSDRVIRPRAESTSYKGNIVENSTLVEDCIKLGIPIKKLQDIRSSLDRSFSPETITKYSAEEAPATADSEDDAVYANTTDRYSSFRSADVIKNFRNNEKPQSPNSRNVREAAISPILPDKKFVPTVASNKNLKNNFGTEVPGRISTDSQNNQDFAAIIEECIQLGMPKRKELSRDTLNSNLSLSSTNSRSNSVTRCIDYQPKVPQELHRSSTLPKGSSYSSSSQNYYSSSEDFSRTGSQRKKSSINLSQDNKMLNMPLNKPDGAMKSPQIRSPIQKDSTTPKIQRVPRINSDACETISDRSQKEEDMEESLYVNVSKHLGYSRSTNRSPSVEIINVPMKKNVPYTANPTKKDVNCSKPDYSALVEECIKLGMPSRKPVEVQKYLKNLNTIPSDTDDQTIKFGSPNSYESEEMQVYVNTTERYSTFNDSYSDSVMERIARKTLPPNLGKNIGESDKEKRGIRAPSSTIEKALEECIQLGWPKRRTNDEEQSQKFSGDVPMKKTEKSVSKNVNVASVVRNMQIQQLACSKVPTLTTGAKVDSEHQNGSMTDVEEMLTGEKNGFEKDDVKNYKSSICSDDNQAESELSFASLADIDVKLLDPQIVLQSLEKYTAKLISEAEFILSCKNVKA